MKSPYIPSTDKDREEMLRAIGVEKIEELFSDIPPEVRYVKFNLPEPLSEAEILREIRQMAEMNADLDHYTCFLGAGAYNHFVPSVVKYVLSRGEFYTAYTPYQPEISQGTLQSIFEYQTMICQLTGMEVANASHYDGATSMAEAALMAYNIHRRKRHKVIVSPAVHPEYRQVLRTYVRGMDINVVGDENPEADIQDLLSLLDQDTICFIIQNPNFFGELEPVEGLADKIHEAGAIFVVVIDPISLGLFKPPGQYGADIVVGEGQPLGNPVAFGGPYLGIFATKMEYVHRMPGRLVGETVDTEGKRGFVLTLSAREQHIRREKATSNICTNQALCALAAGVYLAVMGKEGLRKVAELCYHKAHYAAKRIGEIPGYEVLNKKPFFKEFVVRCPLPPQEINRRLLQHKIIGGYDLGRDYPHLKDCMLLCVTELNTKEEIDKLAELLAEMK